MNHIRAHFLIWLAVFGLGLHGGRASEPVFWFGKTSATLKSRELSGKYILANGILLCNPYAMKDFTVAFVRGGRCYVLHSDMQRHYIGQLPIVGGDCFFLFHGKEDLKALAATVLEGEVAVLELTTLLPKPTPGEAGSP